METIQRKPVFYKLTKEQKEWLKTSCCPICGLPENKWSRRTDWRCCSVDCTNKFSKITFIWQFFKEKAFKRDKYACVKCGEKPTQKTYEGKIIPDTSKLIGDHIIPISIGGEEYDLDNVQTLCEKHNKVKTRQDAKDITIYRKQHKSQTKLKVDFEERNRFIDWLKSKGLKDQSIINYLFYYDKFRSCQNMFQSKVNSFLKKYKYNSIVKSFINNYKVFILTNNKDYDKKVIDNTKSLIIPRETGGKVKKIPDFIIESEVWKIEERFSNERDKLMLLLSFYGGLRIGGLINIRPYSFNWEEWDNSEKNGIKGVGKLKVVEKGDNERIIFVPSKLMYRIEQWIKDIAVKSNPDPDMPLFKIGGRRWQYLLEKCSQKALNKKIHPHTLRHSFATHLLNKGIKIERVQKLMGHKDISTTQIYSHIVQKDIEEDYSNLIDF